MTTTVSPGMAIADRVLNGDSAAVGRAITFIERGSEHVAPMLQRLYPASGSARVIGVTGPPGAGKSTLISVLVTRWRAAGLRVAVLAVDPSSSLTGGALLGDRIRMSELATDSGVFIRSMATRGAVGGLARAAMDAVTVLDAADYDIVVVETVGVGQAEVDVVTLAPTVVVVSVPGLGDGIQALKAGLLEVADIHIVGKADRDGADRTAKDLLESLRLTRRTAGQWNVPVQLVSAKTGDGIEELLAAIDKHRSWLETSGEASRRRHLSARERLLWAAADEGVRRVAQSPDLAGLIGRVATHDIDPLTAVRALLDHATSTPPQPADERGN
ncbi:MAG: methylmalonyl Co-A mutase-associated GTPase MeaB [Tetrasphaera sp.]